MNSQSFSNIITFTRASTAAYVGADGLLKTAAVNEPRFDHDPMTGKRIGLLIEESRTNLLTHSAQVDNAAWAKANLIVTANSNTSPDGGSSADTIIESATNSAHSISRAFSAAAATYTLSIFVKAAGRSKIRLMFGTSGLARGAHVIVDVAAGTVGAVTNLGATAGSTASIAPLSGGWYRASLTVLATAETYYAEVDLVTGTNTVSYTGDGVSGVSIWGAQLEGGRAATSYIPTTTAQVTRSVDLVIIGLGSWHAETNGTYVLETRYAKPASGSVFVLVRGANGRIWYDTHSESTGMRMQSYNGSTALDVGDVSSTNWGKGALALDGATMRGCVNGGSVASAAHAGAFGTGGVSIGSTRFCGHIRSIRFYPYAMTNAELQAVTV